MPTTDKQEAFCQEYVVDRNITQAAIRAGYAPTSARQTAHKVFHKPDIQKRIKELQDEIFERNRVNVDEAVNFLSSIARFDISKCYDEDGNLLPVHQIPYETRLAIEAIDTEEVTSYGKKIATVKKLKVSSRLRSIHDLLRYHGGFEKDNKQKAVQTNPLEMDDPEVIKRFEMLSKRFQNQKESDEK